MRILVAEDEVSIARALKVLLEKSKYAVDMVHSGTDALEYILQTPYDAIVLDIMMPGMDGIEVLCRARAAGITAPTLFLTAKSDIEDRVAGLDAGADDYLPKPFATAEFLARVRALTRRSDSYAHSVLTCGETTLDCDRFELSYGSNVIKLNNKEYQLMELFMRHPRVVFSTERIFDSIWGMEANAELSVVWTYIGFLRRKMKEIGADIELRTVRGAGYALEVVRC